MMPTKKADTYGAGNIGKNLLSGIYPLPQTCNYACEVMQKLIL